MKNENRKSLSVQQQLYKRKPMIVIPIGVLKYSKNEIGMGPVKVRPVTTTQPVVTTTVMTSVEKSRSTFIFEN